MKEKELNAILRMYGVPAEFGVSSYSPGDGVTRYSLGRRDEPADCPDYFADRRIISTTGFANAEKMVRAFCEGYDIGWGEAQ